MESLLTVGIADWVDLVAVVAELSVVRQVRARRRTLGVRLQTPAGPRPGLSAAALVDHVRYQTARLTTDHS